MVNRIQYDQSDTGQKGWSRNVYQAAKETLPGILEAEGGQARFAQIRYAFQGLKPGLCDDSIGDPSNVGAPYWPHIVASAMQALKKSGVIQGPLGGVWLLGNKTSQDLPPNTSASNKKPDALPTKTAAAVQMDDAIKQPGHDLLERILRLSPSEFEKLVVEYLKAKGFSNVEATGRSGDGGIDGHFEMPFIKLKGAFQAKRYILGNNVGIEPVQRLQGSMRGISERGI